MSNNPDTNIKNEILDIKDYRPHPKNYNQHPVEQIRAIELSLKQFGQPESVTVWEHPHSHKKKKYAGYFIAGHGVREAALKAGWSQLRADILPASYDENKALAYIAASNKLAEYSDPDALALARLLDEVKANEPMDLLATGYDENDVNKLLDSLAKESLKVEKALKQMTGDYEERGGKVSGGDRQAQGGDNSLSSSEHHSGGESAYSDGPAGVNQDIESLVMTEAKKLAEKRNVIRQVVLNFGEAEADEYQNLVNGIVSRGLALSESEAVLVGLRMAYEGEQDKNE